MAQTNTLILFIFIFTFANYFTGQLILENDNIQMSDINPLQSIKDDLQFKSDVYEEQEKELGFFDSIAKIGNEVYLFFSSILLGVSSIVILFIIGISNIPVILNILLITPASLIIFFEYVLPLIRGN